MEGFQKKQTKCYDMRENFLNMTIKEKPLEEDMFSLPITQLKTKGITQRFFFPQGQASIRSHHVSFDEEPHWDGICGWVQGKRSGAHQLCPCALQATQRREPLPHKISPDTGEKRKQPPAVISSVWRNVSPVPTPSVPCRGCKDWVEEPMGGMV